MRIFSFSENDRSVLLLDGRSADTSRFRNKSVITTLCAYCGASALQILSFSLCADFKFDSFSSDGMPSNGFIGCAVAFADFLGINGFYAESYQIECPDGVVKAFVKVRCGESKTISFEDGSTSEVVCEGECF